MAFRRGGGAAFGLVQPEQPDEERHHSWSASGIPSTWGPVTFREWLEAQGWSIMDCTAPKGPQQTMELSGADIRQSCKIAVFHTRSEMILSWSRGGKRRELQTRKQSQSMVNTGGLRMQHLMIPIETDDPISLTKTWTVAPTVPDSGKESTQNGARNWRKHCWEEQSSGSHWKLPTKEETSPIRFQEERWPWSYHWWHAWPILGWQTYNGDWHGRRRWLRMACFEFCSSWHKLSPTAIQQMKNWWTKSLCWARPSMRRWYPMWFLTKPNGLQHGLRIWKQMKVLKQEVAHPQ